MALAALRGQQMGIPEHTTTFITTFLKEARYHIKTMIGLTEKGYKSTIDNYLHGPGQGGKASPGIWTVVSSLIMKLMKIKAPGVGFCDPHQQRHATRIMDGFVDDTTAWVNHFLQAITGQEHIDNIVQDLQTSAQWWEELLVATGGQLELPKCFYYIIDWVFNEHGDPILKEHSCKITIHDHVDNTQETIKQKSVTEAHKTLGIMLSPTNHTDQAIKQLQKKIDDASRVMRSTPLTHMEANLMHDCVLLPQLRYGLHVVTAEATQLEKMQAKLIQVLLPAMGYNRHMPTAIRHGPMELCGIGLLDLRTLIGSTKVQHILQQLRLPRITGLMLIIYFNWLQVIAGTSIPILDDARQLPHITDRWIKTVQNFLNKTNSSILIQDLVILQPRREQDIHIMDQIIDSHIWSARETRTLNNWRLYL
jgi:hypothetical protein